MDAEAVFKALHVVSGFFDKAVELLALKNVDSGWHACHCAITAMRQRSRRGRPPRTARSTRATQTPSRNCAPSEVRCCIKHTSSSHHLIITDTVQATRRWTSASST